GTGRQDQLPDWLLGGKEGLLDQRNVRQDVRPSRMSWARSASNSAFRSRIRCRSSFSASSTPDNEAVAFIARASALASALSLPEPPFSKSARRSSCAFESSPATISLFCSGLSI